MTPRFKRFPSVRPTLMLAFAAAISACGDGSKPAPVAPAAGAQSTPAASVPALPAQDDRPVDVVLDDEGLLTFVYASATRGVEIPEVARALPPRVSRMRIAVRAIHDHLLGVTTAPPDWKKLLAALARMNTQCAGGVDAGAAAAAGAPRRGLASVLPVWEQWSDGDQAVERELAIRVTRGFDLVREPAAAKEGTDPKIAAAENLAAIAGTLASPPKAPAASPAAASMAALRVAHLAITLPGDDVPAALATAIEDARALYGGLGWAGGLGVYLEIAASRLSRTAPLSPRVIELTDRARVAFRESGDQVRAALVFVDRAEALRRRVVSQGQPGVEPRSPEQVAADLEGAASHYAIAIDELVNANCRGDEVSDALFTRAELLQMVDRHADAAAVLERCEQELRYAHGDPAKLAPMGERLATSFFRLGRYDEALLAADAAAAVYDANVTGLDIRREALRASIDEIAGEALVSLGRGKEGAERYLAAAKRNVRLPAGDEAATRDRFLAARAFALGGAPQDTKRLVDELMAEKNASPYRGVAASAVLREAGLVADARSALDRAIAALPEANRGAVAAEEARLLAAEGRFAEARARFGAVESAFTGGDAERAGGPEASRVVLDWALMEEAAGDFEAASSVSNRAIGHLDGGRYPVEIDLAQETFVRSLRRRAYFGAAATIAAQRLQRGVPGTTEHKADAAIDLALIHAEVATNGNPTAVALAEASVAASGVADVLGPLVGKPGRAAAAADLPRVARIADFLHKTDALQAPALLARAAKCATSEPEVARFLLRLAASPSKSAGIDWVQWLDLWCGRTGVTSAKLEAAVRSCDASFVAVVPMGTSVVLFSVAANGTVVSISEPGDSGVAALWDAVHVEPTTARLTEAAQLAAAPGRPLRKLLASAGSRVVICVPGPGGPIPAAILPSAAGNVERTLLDEAVTAFVTSPTEFVAAAARTADGSLTILSGPERPLTTRYALCPVAAVDPKWGKRIASLAAESLAKGADLPTAIRDAKKALRSEWKADPERDVVPPWAAYELRGAPPK